MDNRRYLVHQVTQETLIKENGKNKEKDWNKEMGRVVRCVHLITACAEGQKLRSENQMGPKRAERSHLESLGVEPFPDF